MDITRQFSLIDFLAYFFPGLFASIGIYFLLLLTPIQNSLITIKLDLATSLIFFALSYIFGIFLSNISLTFTKMIERITGYKNPDNILTEMYFQEEVIDAYRDVNGIDKESEIQWTKWHFRLCRAMVHQKMPFIAERANRQSSIRQLRINLITPIIIWLFVGVGWGISMIQNSQIYWGYLLIIVSIFLSSITIFITIKRMHGNERREVREILIGFLAGYKIGLFNNEK